MGLATAALITTAATSTVSAGYSIHQGEQAKKTAKKEARRQREILQEQEAKTLSNRKSLIKQQRAQLGLDNTFNTNTSRGDGGNVSTGDTTSQTGLLNDQSILG